MVAAAATAHWGGLTHVAAAAAAAVAVVADVVVVVVACYTNWSLDHVRDTK